MALYVIAIVVGLRAIHVWKGTFLKDTVFWFCFTGIGIFFGSVTSDNKENIFRRTVADSVKVVVLIEFLVNMYTFPLVYELAVVPVVVVIAMMDAVAQTDKKYASVTKLTAGILSVVGLLAVGFAVFKAILNYDNLRSADTVRDLLLPPLLSVLFLPFVYSMLVFTKYELIFVRLGFGSENDPTLKRYAKRRIIMHCRLNLKRVNACLRHHASGLMQVRNKEDVDRILTTMKRHDSGDAI